MGRRWPLYVMRAAYTVVTAPVRRSRDGPRRTGARGPGRAVGRPRARPRRADPPVRARRWWRSVDGSARRAVPRGRRAGRRPAHPRPARQLDVRVLRRRRRPAPRGRPRDPRPRPAEPDGQMRGIGRVLGRRSPPTFAHHPLVRRPDGRKLSKSAGDTAVRELRASGESAEAVIAMAASATGYPGESHRGQSMCTAPSGPPSPRAWSSACRTMRRAA